MSNLSFRPRPIDVNRAIPVYTDADAEEIDESQYASAAALSRSVPQMPTGMEAEEEEEAHIQEAIKRSLNSMTAHLEEASAIDIPTPTVKVVEGYDEAPNPNPFEKPTAYIKFSGYDDDFVDYDMDTDDDDFVRNFNATNPHGKKLSESKFELIMDRLEREADRKNGVIPSLSDVGRFIDVKHIFLEPVYHYWVQRRQKMKHPLLMRYLKPPDHEDPDPYKAFRPRMEEKFKRKGRKNDQASLMKMRQLRQEMERARTLLEMIKKREKLKRDELELFSHVIELRLEDAKLFQGEGADYDLTPPLPPIIATPPIITPSKKKKFAPAEPKRKRPVYEEPSYSDLESEEAEEPALSDVEYSPSEDEAELPPSPRTELLEQQQLSDTDIHQIDGDAFPVATPHIITLRVRGAPAFRGRARLGRGGRLVLDRRPLMHVNGVINHPECDPESDPRTHSITAMLNSGYHPLIVGHTDAGDLLKKLDEYYQHQLAQSSTSATSSASTSSSSSSHKRRHIHPSAT